MYENHPSYHSSFYYPHPYHHALPHSQLSSTSYSCPSYSSAPSSPTSPNTDLTCFQSPQFQNHTNLPHSQPETSPPFFNPCHSPDQTDHQINHLTTTDQDSSQNISFSVRDILNIPEITPYLEPRHNDNQWIYSNHDNFNPRSLVNDNLNNKINLNHWECEQMYEFDARNHGSWNGNGNGNASYCEGGCAECSESHVSQTDANNFPKCPELSPYERKYQCYPSTVDGLKIDHDFNEKLVSPGRKSDDKTHQVTSSRSELRKKRSTSKSESKRKSRVLFTHDQVTTLEATFKRTRYLNQKEREILSTRLGMTSTQVKIWFQNRRYKWNKSAQELDPNAKILGKFRGDIGKVTGKNDVWSDGKMYFEEKITQSDVLKEYRNFYQ